MAKKKLDGSYDSFFDIPSIGFPEDPVYLPYLLSVLALNNYLATNLYHDLKSWIRQEINRRRFIIISVISGKHLAHKDNKGPRNPVVEVKYGKGKKDKKRKRTPEDIKQTDSLNPRWEIEDRGERKGLITIKGKTAESNYPNVIVYGYARKKDITITCYDRSNKSDDFMGQFKVSTNLPFEKKQFPLLEKEEDVKIKNFAHVSGLITISLSFANKKGVIVD